MTYHQIILISFVSVVAVIMVSAFLLKIYRQEKEKEVKREGQRPSKINMKLKGDIYELGKLAMILEDLDRYGVPLKTILELNVILEEVFTGIVTHQKKNQQDTNVLIRLVLETGRITATIADHNDEFNPTLIPEIDVTLPLEEVSFRGLGFHLVRHLADQVSYQRKEGKNLLTIKKNYQA